MSESSSKGGMMSGSKSKGSKGKGGMMSGSKGDDDDDSDNYCVCARRSGWSVGTGLEIIQE